MHHLAVKSNHVETTEETTKLSFGGNNNVPLCPKPRRLGPTLPEFLKPFGCSNHRLAIFPFLLDNFFPILVEE